MRIYPNAYFESVKEISIDFLKENNIQGLILDVDNTLIDFDKNLSEDVIEWSNQLKKLNIKQYILSNTNKLKKVKSVSDKLDIGYEYFAKKPLKSGFYKVAKILNLNNENIAVVGDQIFTDVIGANNCGMYSILVKPVDKRDIFVTKIKRPLEKMILNKYLKEKKKCI